MERNAICVYVTDSYRILPFCVFLITLLFGTFVVSNEVNKVTRNMY
jgi:hypothetical protein